MAFLEVLKNILDTLGSVVIVPVMIFIIALFMRVPVKKAFISGLSIGIGLEGFNLLIGSFSGVIAPVVQRMVDVSGINLPIFDIGWQAGAMIAYSTNIGLLFMGLCIALQLLMFATKFTNVFQATDLWNNYSYMIYGSMCYLVTKNFWLSFGCMLVLLLFTTVCAEFISRRFANYYGYEGCTVSMLHIAGDAPYAFFMNWLLNKFGLYKIKADPTTLKKRLGFIGDPMVLGAIVGLILGISGNFDRMLTLEGLGSILTCTIATSAVMTIFPKIASIFAGAFTSITSAARKNAKGKDMIISVNDATVYGETAGLTTGLICMPIILLLAFILLGNKVLPVLNLVAIPYGMLTFISMSNGNIVKSVISALGKLILTLYISTLIAPMFTQIALSVGIEIAAGLTLVTAWGSVDHPIGIAVMYAFISGNPLIIGGVIVADILFYVLFKKNKNKILDFVEKEAYRGMEDVTDNVSVDAA